MRRGIYFGASLSLLIFVGFVWYLHYRTTLYDTMISLSAARNGVDFYLVKALIYEESWFRPEIRGPSGEIGLMQVSNAAAHDFTTHKGFPSLTEARLMEPDLNIEIGSWYLHQSLERYKNSPAPVLFALLRYNAGEVRADTWLQLAKSRPVPRGMPAEEYCLSLVDFPKTREYARRILRRFRSQRFWF